MSKAVGIWYAVMREGGWGAQISEVKTLEQESSSHSLLDHPHYFIIKQYLLSYVQLLHLTTTKAELMFQFGTTVLIKAVFTPCADEFVNAVITTVEGTMVIDRLDTDDVIRIGLGNEGYIWGILLEVDEDISVADIRLLTNHIDPKGWDRTYLGIDLGQLQDPSILIAAAN